MALWSDILDQVGQQYNIVNWGREIECGRPYGILRFSTCNMKPKHLHALSKCIETGKHLLQEVSIHFTCSYPPEKQDDYENPFLPGGQHYKYLSWLDHLIPPICNPYPQPKLVQSQLSRSATKVTSADMRPKDGNDKTSGKALNLLNITQNNPEKHYLQTLQRILKTFSQSVAEMPNLKLLAFYNLDVTLFKPEWQNQIMEAICNLSRRLFQFEGLVIKNCQLGPRCAQIVERLKYVYSLRLLSLSQCDLDNSVLDSFRSMIISHKNYRDEKLWEKSLKNKNITFSRSGSLAATSSVARSAVKSRASSSGKKQTKPKTPKVKLESPNQKIDKDTVLLDSKSRGALKKISFSQEELFKMRIRAELKGISFIDFSYNGLDNTFCDVLLDVLRNDSYVHSLELLGNHFDLKSKVLRTGQTLIDVNMGENINWAACENVPVNKDIKTPTTAIYSKLMRGQTKSLEQLSYKSPKIQQVNNKLYLPIEVAIQRDLLEKLDHFSTLDNFQVYILEHIRPRYLNESNNTLTTVQLMQNYCTSASELDELMQLNAHPLVELLLANTTILYLTLDESTNYALQKFVQLRLDLNRKCCSDLLLKHCERELTDIERDEMQLSLQNSLKNIESIAKRLQFKKSISQQRQSRSASQIRQMQEQFGESNVNDLIKQHESSATTGRASKSNNRQKTNQYQPTEKVLNEIRDGVLKNKYRLHNVNDREFLEAENKRQAKKEKRSQSATQSRAKSEKKPKTPEKKKQAAQGRTHVVKTTTSIQNVKMRSGSNPKQKQQHVSAFLSRVPKQENQSIQNSKVTDEQTKIQHLLAQIEQQKAELRSLQLKVLKETKQASKQVQKNKNHSNTEDETQQIINKQQKKGYSQNHPNPNFDSDKVFDNVLDAAYEVLMRKSNRNRDLAVQKFNENQEIILETCERLMNAVKEGLLEEGMIVEKLNQSLQFQ